ncbi:MAG: Asp-tRNA(Asn)/Glu-tRNA(Gln) amidotransferase subunit GatA [Candidatus Lokiarchaeota archaeon]|nr:Asp-tRNA(Asn)/Glu-tRNA(Gln) amidotransferase subunit GatA [Candidatus Lokiarchaeota archaeon]
MLRITEVSIKELIKEYKSGSINVEEVIHKTFDRIEKIEPKINSFILQLKEQALQQAQKLDKEIKNNKEPLGNLFGIPIAIKDNMCVKGYKTTCASKMLEDFIPPYNSTVVQRLLDQGAIVIGKTNMDEFAMGTTTETSYFGATKNPWDLGRVPGGSSGGSGSAIASGESLLALGSDTGGSVRCPASFCGCIGLKATYGLVSRYGLIAYACSLEQIGPMARRVSDCKDLFYNIIGYDPMDSTTISKPKTDEIILKYSKASEKSLNGFKFGIIKELVHEGIEPEVEKQIWNAIKKLESLGGGYEEISIPLIDYSIACYYIIAMAEASSNLARFDGIRYGNREKDEGTFNEVFARNRLSFGDEVRRRIMLGTYTLSAGYYDMYYYKALKIRTLLINEFKKYLNKFDVLISPSMPVLPFKIGEKIDDPLSMYMADVCTVPINITGLPAISIPCGFSGGLPVGLQIIGNYFDEGRIFKIAELFEKNTNYDDKKPEI